MIDPRDSDPTLRAEVEPDSQERTFDQMVNDRSSASENDSSSLRAGRKGEKKDSQDAITEEFVPSLSELPSGEVTTEFGAASVISASQTLDSARTVEFCSHPITLSEARQRFDCRICGRALDNPRPQRWRGRRGSQRAFVCDTCDNVICAAHAVRVSTLWEGVTGSSRFRCVLCRTGRSRTGKSTAGSSGSSKER